MTNEETLNAETIQNRISTLKNLREERDDLYASALSGSEFHFRLGCLEDHIRCLQNTGGGPLIGMPCTYTIGSDDYASVVVGVSPSGHQVTIHLHGEDVVFTRRGGVEEGKYRPKGSKSGYLTFLEAITDLDPSF